MSCTFLHITISVISEDRNILQQEGLKVGQQVLAVSDPVNEGQMLSLESQPSKMALIRAMNMRRYPEIEMVFSSEVASVAAKIIKEAKDTGAHMTAYNTHTKIVCQHGAALTQQHGSARARAS